MNVTSIYQTDPDDILTSMETASEAQYAVERELAEAEANFKSYEAVTILAIRDNGCKSMNEAELRARCDVNWQARFAGLAQARAEAAKFKRDFSIATSRLDAWRSANANQRKV